MIQSLNHRLPVLIYAHEGRIRVYQSLLCRTDCLVIQPLLMRGITCSRLYKSQLLNQLWNFGGTFSPDFLPDSEWLSAPATADYQRDVRFRTDQHLLRLYAEALDDELPDSLRRLLESQRQLLRVFVSQLAEFEPLPSGRWLLRA